MAATDDVALGEAFAEFITRAAGARAVHVSACQRLGGGAIQDNYSLEVDIEGGAHAGHQALVVRMDAPSRIAASLAREQEYAVLRAAHAAGVTVPEPLWCCPDAAVAGRPFYVMRRVAGIAAAHRLLRDPMLDEARREALVRRLGSELALLHGIRPPREDLVFLAQPRPSVALERVARYRRWLDEMDTPRPALEWALRWLERNAPPPRPVVLVHSDYRTGNYMVEGGRLTGILDWEFAAWGDPYEDLGWFCARCWRFGAWDREAGGIATREPFYAAYAAACGTPVDEDAVTYWEVMAAVRWGVLAVQQAERHLSGDQRSLELALTGRMVPQMELDALALVARLEAA